MVEVMEVRMKKMLLVGGGSIGESDGSGGKLKAKDGVGGGGGGRGKNGGVGGGWDGGG